MPSRKRYWKNRERWLAAGRAYRERVKQAKARRKETNRRYYLKNKPALLLIAEQYYHTGNGGRVEAARRATADLWGD